MATKTTVSKPDVYFTLFKVPKVVWTPVAQGDAKFRNLTMRPFFEENILTDLPNLEDNQELQQAKEARTKEGDAYLAKFI